MSKTFLAGAFATVLCASLAAQAQTPSPSSSAPQQPATSAAAKSGSITVEGCIQRSASSATSGATGTSGSALNDSAFILASAMKPAGTSGSSASATMPIASSYRLDAADSKLSPHVGHKVEISGTLEPAASSPAPSSAAMASPKLKVDNVKMIAATCIP
jgi:hypothetical protein